MAITFKGLDAIDSDYDSQGDSTFRVTYKSQASKRPEEDNEIVVTAAVVQETGFYLGSAWTNDASAFCRGIHSRCVNRRGSQVDGVGKVFWEWITEYIFSTKAEESNNPLTHRLQVSMSVHKYDQPTTQAAGGAPIENSAGSPVIRMKKRSKVIFRFSRNMPAWDWKWCQEAPNGFMYSMNATEWTLNGRAFLLLGDSAVRPLCARIEDIRVELVINEKMPNGGYVKVDMEVHVDEDGFSEKFFDQGFFARASGPTMPYATNTYRITDRNGIGQRPVNLDGAGNKNPDGADPVTLTYNLYLVKNWNESPLKEYFS